MKLETLISFINKLLLKTYPIKTNFNNINELSHFEIQNFYLKKFIPFQFDIKGYILNGNYTNWKIIKVETTKIMNWKEYLYMYIYILNQRLNPCIDMNKFLYLLVSYNLIDELNIKKIIIKKNSNYKTIDIQYTENPSYKLKWDNNSIIKKNQNNNHFYFNSFYDEGFKQIKKELDRLIKFRDTYDNIHFHLDNNDGGHLVPAHLILRCLTGKEKWMKNIKKVLQNKMIYEWDCWKEEEIDSPNYEVVKKLNLNQLPNYNTKYKGKIYLHMSKINCSASWFFITYLIYSFGGKIKRYNKKCYGYTIKYGSISSNSNLKLLGHSGTSSGDGSIIHKIYKNIDIVCPTEQFISSSIKERDWNRFWVE
jgi:hypothetical protein